MTHICVSKLTSIGSDNGLSPSRRQAIIWTNARILLIGPLRKNFSEILIGNQTFSLKKMHLKLSSAKWRLFHLGLNELIFKDISGMCILRISCEIAMKWMSQDMVYDKSTLVQVMVRCHQATKHYLRQCWPRFLLLCGVTRLKWVKRV